MGDNTFENVQYCYTVPSLGIIFFNLEIYALTDKLHKNYLVEPICWVFIYYSSVNLYTC
jgi:hypothetical protein